jgi:hypothetical protein
MLESFRASESFASIHNQEDAMKGLLATVAVSAGLLAGVSAFAQNAQPTPAAQAKPAAASGMSAADKQAKSKACSAEADKQGLHGKARKTFRNACKHKP